VKQRNPLLLAVLLLFLNCEGGDPATPEDELQDLDRHGRIPVDAVKKTPETDLFPPILHSAEFQEPVPFSAINTAGAEDSPFVPADRDEFYFVFVKDAREPVEIQIRDPVNGIWVSRREGGVWQEATLVVLQRPDQLALNGCTFVQGSEMYFCTAREGYTGLHWFRAEYADSRWDNWQPADFPEDFDVGELHVHGDELYYHSGRAGGQGGEDIWMVTRDGGGWVDPVNIEAANTPADEGMPYVTPDGRELWFNRWYQGSPALFRSRKVGDSWQEAELIVSQFAGEPTLDRDGNLYFAHHFYEDGLIVEADIYVAYRK
jgi:hypothetical protein